ncbi:hypothetical protein OE88DRAFT_1661853 [Heliocybe sulcata]|uniref:Uncharacterized protein n=1 Tax=Heliocybe sulcata TaxID=5364 RepID=A0A5C3MY27_9AGAM|nr:hypothetical protein OE88DRAFT_1661853 [Heliocybe sulcata]
MQAIPTELVSKIFVHCLDAESDFIKPNPGHAPLLLTQMCASFLPLLRERTARD